MEIVVDDLAETPELTPSANPDARLCLEGNAGGDTHLITDLDAAARARIQLHGALRAFDSYACAEANLSGAMHPYSAGHFSPRADAITATQDELTPNRAERAMEQRHSHALARSLHSPDATVENWLGS
jgi:hypothetical protein